jgi:hypothetical protein
MLNFSILILPVNKAIPCSMFLQWLVKERISLNKSKIAKILPLYIKGLGSGDGHLM